MASQRDYSRIAHYLRKFTPTDPRHSHGYSRAANAFIHAFSSDPRFDPEVIRSVIRDLPTTSGDDFTPPLLPRQYRRSSATWARVTRKRVRF